MSCACLYDDCFAESLKNYFKTVSEHKEIVRIFMGLQGAMYLLKPDVIRLLQVLIIIMN